jgi:hypothetical protein
VNGKTLALLARFGRLNGSIDRQKIGLIRKIVHRGDDLTPAIRSAPTRSRPSMSKPSRRFYPMKI